MNKRHYEHTLPNIRGSLSNTYLVFTTDYHRLRVLITNDGKFTLCYSVSSVVSSDTPSF